jgi:hypothetical protein
MVAPNRRVRIRSLGVHVRPGGRSVDAMSEAPHRDHTPPASEPLSDPDPEAAAEEQDEDDLDPDERTADPDLGEQDASDVPPGPQNPVDPDRHDSAS